MNKRGQLDISFSMIFTILIIIVTIAVASYVIFKFVNLNKCQQITTFYSDFDKEVRNAYSSGLYEGNRTYLLDKGIKAVCFGNLSQTTLTKADSEIQKILAETGNERHNMFFYPSGEACDYKFRSKKQDFIVMDKFFCIPTNNGRLTIKMIKGEEDLFVKLSK
jgi:hypothetical protein